MFTLVQHRAFLANPDAETRGLIARGGQCIGVVRRSWGIGSLGGSAYAAWDAVPSSEMHYTAPIDVPEGAICYGLNGQHGQARTTYGHAWLANVNLLGRSTDYSGLGTWKDAPMSLPRWTGDAEVQWTSWTPYGRLPVGRTQRQRNAVVIPPTYSFRQGKQVFSSKMHQGQLNSDSVWNLALALHNRGFLKTAPVDDYLQPVVDACAAFQRSQHWNDADGIAGPLTVKTLGLIWVVG